MEKTETVFKKDTLRRHCLLRLTCLFCVKTTKWQTEKLRNVQKRQKCKNMYKYSKKRLTNEKTGSIIGV